MDELSETDVAYNLLASLNQIDCNKRVCLELYKHVEFFFNLESKEDSAYSKDYQHY